MSDQLPDDAVTAAAKVIHSLTCGECDYPAGVLTRVSARDREDATKVLAAAAPAIAARAAAGERERIRQLAIKHNAIVVSMNVDKPMDIIQFADLIGEAP